MKKSVKKLIRRNLEQARQDRAGPYREEWRRIDRADYTKPDGSIEGELHGAQTELENFLESQGRRRPFFHFDGETYGYRPSVNDRIGEAADLLCEIAAIRAKLQAGELNPDTLGRVFRLGRNLETWRLMPFSKPAAGGINASVNAEQQQKKRLGKKLPNKELWEWFCELRKKHPEDLVVTTREQLSKSIEVYEGKKITQDAVKKRLNKYKKNLGKQI